VVPESLSRAVNDRVRAAAAQTAADVDATFGFLCGCGCSTLVVMSVAEYDRRCGDVLKLGHSRRGPEIELAPTGFADLRF
jgi:hypothetical protein